MSYPSGLVIINHIKNITSSASISFSSIPTIYTHLILTMNVIASSATINSDTLSIRFNGDTGANYHHTGIFASGSSVSEDMVFGATSGILGTIGGLKTNANRNSRIFLIIPFYTNTSFFKTYISQSTAHTTALATGVFIDNRGGTWVSTSAITSITLFATGGGNVGVVASPNDFQLCGLV